MTREKKNRRLTCGNSAFPSRAVNFLVETGHVFPFFLLSQPKLLDALLGQWAKETVEYALNGIFGLLHSKCCSSDDCFGNFLPFGFDKLVRSRR